ncbi:MAG: HEAT repeat domain-containing protein [Endomicrobiales bacterium]
MLNQEAIGNLIKSFHLTVTYLKIYPPTSQMVVATLDTFYRTIQKHLDENPSLTFSELSNRLLVDGTEAESRETQLIGNNILKLLSQRKVQSITFRTGLPREELVDFLSAILRKKREELPPYSHIALDQTVYVAMVKGEEAVVRITEMVQNSGSDMVNLIKTLRESYDLIDQLPDQASRAQVQDRLAQELAKQDTTVLREIFERELPPKIEESGLKPKLLSALSQEKIHEIFGEIAVWYEAVRKNEASDFAAVDQLEKLKKFMRAILQAPASKEIPRQYFEELLRKGLLDQLPEWFSQAPAKPTTVFEAERLLEKSPGDLLDRQTLESLPGLAEKLCQIENDDLLAKLVEKMLENLRNSAARVRLPAAQSVTALYGILQAHAREPLLRFMELPLLEAARQETSAEVHKLLVELLRQRACQDLLHGAYDLALRIINLLRQHTSAEFMADEKIRADTSAALSHLIREIMEVLIADLKSDNEEKRLGSLQLLAKMEQKAIEPLIRVVKESDDIRSRRLAALALKNIGGDAVKRFNEELNLGLLAEEIRRVVEVLTDFGTEETIEHLHSLLRYPDTAVKKEIMKFLSRLNTNQSRLLLIAQLKDADAAAVSEAARLVGELKCAEAVPSLIAALEANKCPANLQEELCTVLGNIGSSQAVPVLMAKLRKRSFWAARAHPETERVRMRAAWSLRKFSSPPVERALEAASRGSDPVALTARESLAVLRRGMAPR